MYLAHSLCPARKIYMKTIPINKSINPLLTKLVWSRWLDMGQVLFFVVAILWTSAQSPSINNDEKRTWLISPLFSNAYIYNDLSF